MRNYSTLIFVFLCYHSAFLQNQVLEISNEIDVVRLTSVSKKKHILELALPLLKTPNQNLVSWKPSGFAESVFINDLGQNITFSLPKLKKKKKYKMGLDMQINVRPYFYDDFVKYNYAEVSDRDTSKYLTLSNISIDEKKLLIKINDELKDKGRHQMLVSMINFLHRDFEMDKIKIAVADRIEEILKTKKLSPGDAANLLVALCRVANIPARIVTGHMVRKDQEVGFTLYYWVEVYITGKGWVNYDPYFSALERKSTGVVHSDYLYIAFKYNDHLINSSSVSHTIKCPYQTFNYVTFRNINDELEIKADGFYQQNSNDLAILYYDSLLMINPYDYRALTKKAVAEARIQKFENGLKYLMLAQNYAEDEADISHIMYAFANYFALKRERENFLTYLEVALSKDFMDYFSIITDQDLKFYKDDVDFIRIISRLKPRDHKK